MSEQLTLVKGQKGFELELNNKENWVLLKEEGYSPVQSVVAATGACGGYVYQDILNRSNIPHTFHKVTVTYERDIDKKTNPIKLINMTFYVSVDKSLQSKALSAVTLVSRFCPVIQSLNSTIIVKEHIIFTL